jgi:hypothetical protein
MSSDCSKWSSTAEQQQKTSRVTLFNHCFVQELTLGPKKLGCMQLLCLSSSFSAWQMLHLVKQSVDEADGMSLSVAVAPSLKKQLGQCCFCHEGNCRCNTCPIASTAESTSVRSMHFLQSHKMEHNTSTLVLRVYVPIVAETPFVSEKVVESALLLNSEKGNSHRAACSTGRLFWCAAQGIC